MRFRPTVLTLAVVALLALVVLAGGPSVASPAVGKPRPTTTTSPATTTTTTEPLVPLSLANVIQQNDGVVSTAVSNFDVSLPSPTTPGNLLIAFIAVTNSNSSVGVAPSPFQFDQGINFATNTPAYAAFEGDSDGNSTWTFPIVSGASKVSWWIAEVSDLNAAHVPPTGTFAKDENIQVTTNDVNVSSLALPQQPGDSLSDEEIVFEVYMPEVTSGTPPTVTGVTDTSTVPISWAQLGNTEATSGAGANSRLDVYVGFPHAQGRYSSTVTWSGVAAGAGAATLGFNERTQPQIFTQNRLAVAINQY